MLLTGIIIAKDEEDMIADAIDSLKFCDEVVIVDNDSKDRTKELAQKLGANVFTASENSFSRLREIGREKAKGEWIFYLDSDERATEALGKEILEKIRLTDFAAYKVSRKNFYFGKNEWPVIEKLERLFLKSALKGWKGKLHETPLYDGKLGDLENSITHFTHRDLTSMLNKTIEWSDVEARNRLEAKHPKMSWWRFPRVMISTFLTYYIKQKGYRAGTAGLIESIFQSYSTFITYAKLWEMQNKLT